MPRLLPLVLCLLLCGALPARAADPIMPLSDVREGMQCTGYSVVRGTEISSFDVEIRDVVDDETRPGARLILFHASGPAIDATGLGPGFSGSPIYCPGSDGTMRNAGAIAFGLGDYGNKVGLATPIEQVLAEPVAPPRAAQPRLPRPLAGLPLVVTGMSSPALGTLRQAARRAGRMVLSAPPAPLRSFPPQTLRPGASVAVGMTAGDVAVGAVGTVTYTDGDRVWAFGHPLDAAGARSLFLQDAYVYEVINNPVAAFGVETYKLAAPGRTLGELTGDGLFAVVGRTGALGPSFPLRVRARDLDAGTEGRMNVRFADEADVGQPLGNSWLTLVGPLIIAQAGHGELGGTPARLSGTLCLHITLRERSRPLRFCNRYVSRSSIVAPEESGVSGALERIAEDALSAFELVDDYRFANLHVTDAFASVSLERGLRQAFIAGGRASRAARPGGRVAVRLLLNRVGGGTHTVRFTLRVPRSVRPGQRLLTLTGTPDDGEIDLPTRLEGVIAPEAEAPDPRETGGTPGAGTVDELAAAVARIHRYDGVRARFSGQPRGVPSRRTYRDPQIRISGRIDLPVRILGNPE